MVEYASAWLSGYGFDHLFRVFDHAVAYYRKIWIGTYDGGLYVYDKKAKSGARVKCYRANDTPWLPSDRIYDIKEDSQGKVWLGTSYGFSMLTQRGIFAGLICWM